MDMTSVFAPITKTVEQDDGSVLVYGKATDGGLDGDLQRCSPSWLATAMPAWYSNWGNVREQHDAKRAIGKAVDHEVDGDSHYITARIVDPVAVLKTKAGVFNGFSIGISRPKISKTADAPNGMIDGGEIVELSLCDRPSNAGCRITLVKAATPGMEINASDFDEERGLVKCEELVETPEAVEKAAAADEATDEGLTASLADRLPPEQVEKLAAAADPGVDAEPVEAAEAAEKAAAGLLTLNEARAQHGGGGGDEAPADVAKALVAAELAKADDDMTDFPQPDDETLATLAISIVSRLIQSEAGDMVSNPGEDDDIRCLLSAVSSLRWFIRRERQERSNVGGPSDAAPYEYAELAATPDAEKAVEAATEQAAEKTIVVVNDPPAPELVAAVAKAGMTGDPVDSAPAVATKAIDPDTAKASVVEETDSTDPDALVKALTAALSKSDSPLRQTFESIVNKATETTAKAVDELTARLVKVESMAVPGGPALRRTEVERSSARRNDLYTEVLRVKSLADSTHDPVLRKGYTAQAAQLEAEIRALAA